MTLTCVFLNILEKNPCGPSPGCAPPPPDVCAGSIYEIINGEKCFTGCTYPKCKKVIFWYYYKVFWGDVQMTCIYCRTIA